MSAPFLREILAQVQNGQLPIDEALARMQSVPVAELEYATVDLQRKNRCGFPEVVFAEGKTREWLDGIVRRIQAAGQDCLATRLNSEQIEHMTRNFLNAEIDVVGRTFWLPHGPRGAPEGRLAILTAGTGDLPVAREALVTAQAMGCAVDLIVDVGVAGLHRLLRQRDTILAADVIIVVAGMDGALPSVVGGLVDCPVIAVPTSIGYGTAFQGVAPLLTMLNACSANVVCVNIDAGFKAAFAGALMVRRRASRSSQDAS